MWNILKDYIKKTEKKLAKTIGLLYRTKSYFDETSFKAIYFSYILSYLNYANIPWASTRTIKLKTLLYNQKQAVCIVFNEGRLCHSKPLFKILDALNVYKINLYQHLKFMYWLRNSDILAIFNDIVKKPENKYPTRFPSLNYTFRKYSFTNSRFSIFSLGPKLWNEILNKEKKDENPIHFLKNASN